MASAPIVLVIGPEGGLAEEERGAFLALCRGEHGDEGEDNAVDQHRIEGIERAQRHRKRICAAVGAEQIGHDRDARDAQQVAGQDTGDDGQPAAHQWAFYRAREDALGVERRR